MLCNATTLLIVCFWYYFSVLFVVVSYTVDYVTVKHRQTKDLQGIPGTLCPKFWTPTRLPPQFSENFEKVFRVAPTRKIGLDNSGGVW